MEHLIEYPNERQSVTSHDWKTIFVRKQPLERSPSRRRIDAFKRSRKTQLNDIPVVL